MSMTELYNDLCESTDIRVYHRAFRDYEDCDE